MPTSRLIIASLLVSTPAFAVPSGHLGFVGKNGAQILNLRNSKLTSLPQGARATVLTLSPRGAAIYFVPVAGVKAKDAQSDVPTKAALSAPPYSWLKPLPSFGTQVPYWWYWNPAGTKLYLSTDKSWGTFTVKTGQYTPIKIRQQSFDARQRQMAYSTENQILVRDVALGRDRVLFDIRKPAPLFAAMRAAKSPKNLKDLLSLQNDPMIKDPQNWMLSDPAFAPDGSRVYFASNAGTDSGAAGNTSFALFVIDLKTGHLRVLSKVGTLFGRMPHIFQVSPDGQRLLMASSVHDSAADNSCFVKVVDLQTQNSREVFEGVLPGSKDKANFLDSAIWSPDSEYVALSGYFYDANEVFKEGTNWSDPKRSQYTTGIVNARTGYLAKTIRGAGSLSWIR